MKKPGLALVLFLVSVTMMLQNAVAAPVATSPDKVTQELYHAAMENFGFTAGTVKAEKPWLAPDLYSRMLKKANQPVPKGDAPDIEGDLFLNCQDPPDKFVVGKSTIDQARAKVEVTLLWPSEKRLCTVLLKQVDGNWKVYDVDYGKDGLLSDLLK